MLQSKANVSRPTESSEDARSQPPSDLVMAAFAAMRAPRPPAFDSPRIALS